MPPYEIMEHLELKYSLCSKNNAKDMHLYAIQNKLGKPLGIPDEEMIRHPIWSSWAQYKADINQSTIIDFARKINEYNFPVAQIEIG